MNLLKSREAILALAILVLLALVAGRFPGFVAPRNLASVFTDTAPLIILALAKTLDKAGDGERALNYYRLFLKEAPENDPDRPSTVERPRS